MTATDAPVESQGTMEVQFQLACVHGEKITVTAMFELLLAVMGNELGSKICNGRDTSPQNQWCVYGAVGVVSSRASKIQEMMLDHQTLRAKLQHREHNDFHTH